MQAAFGHLDGFRAVLHEQAGRCGTMGHDRDAVEHALEQCDHGDEWLDATTSMHLLVLDGKIWIREGRDKSSLRGLADLHPAGTNHLYVLYSWQGQFYEAEGESLAVCDLELCTFLLLERLYLRFSETTMLFSLCCCLHI